MPTRLSVSFGRRRRSGTVCHVPAVCYLIGRSCRDFSVATESNFLVQEFSFPINLLGLAAPTFLPDGSKTNWPFKTDRAERLVCCFFSSTCDVEHDCRGRSNCIRALESTSATAVAAGQGQSHFFFTVLCTSTRTVLLVNTSLLYGILHFHLLPSPLVKLCSGTVFGYSSYKDHDPSPCSANADAGDRRPRWFVDGSCRSFVGYQHSNGSLLPGTGGAQRNRRGPCRSPARSSLVALCLPIFHTETVRKGRTGSVLHQGVCRIQRPDVERGCSQEPLRVSTWIGRWRECAACHHPGARRHGDREKC